LFVLVICKQRTQPFIAMPLGQDLTPGWLATHTSSFLAGLHNF
jgi:hypothetical protein